MNQDEQSTANVTEGQNPEPVQADAPQAAPAAPSASKRKRMLTAEERKKRRRKKKIRKIIRIAIPAALLIAFIVFGVLFLIDFHEYRVASQAYKELDSHIQEKGVKTAKSVSVPASAQMISLQDETSEAEPVEEEAMVFDYPDLDIDFAALTQVNKDFVGILYIPSLDLRYPVVHSKDNQEYLKKTYDGITNSAGAIFLDYLASSDMEDKNTFIFGHNMRNQSMFGSLKRFVNEEELAASDPYVYFYTSDCVRKYEIFSYYFSYVGSDAYQNFVGDDGYDEYVRKAKENSLFLNDVVDLSQRPNILTLSTCSGTEHVRRLLVHSALIGKAFY
ncbi:MAG: class B sortase [Lachnospiraceae bacterium]|nr:class B sortase [Lachnospiraceae bacterium]